MTEPIKIFKAREFCDVLAGYEDNFSINQKNIFIMRQRIIKKQGAVSYVKAYEAAGTRTRRFTAYNVTAVVLYLIIVGGTALYQGTKEDCDSLCIELRMRNVAAEVVKAN